MREEGGEEQEAPDFILQAFATFLSFLNDPPCARREALPPLFDLLAILDKIDCVLRQPLIPVLAHHPAAAPQIQIEVRVRVQIPLHVQVPGKDEWLHAALSRAHLPSKIFRPMLRLPFPISPPKRFCVAAQCRRVVAGGGSSSSSHAVPPVKEKSHEKNSYHRGGGGEEEETPPSVVTARCTARGVLMVIPGRPPHAGPHRVAPEHHPARDDEGEGG